MVNAIGSERSYIYETSTGSSAASLALEQMCKRQNSTTNEVSSDTTASQMTEYSASEHLEMMKSRKLPPELEEILAQMSEESAEDTTEDETATVTQTATTSNTQVQGDISAIDADGDGTISTDEYEVMIEQMGIAGAMSADEFFTEYDTNEDGEISLEEMPEPGSIEPSMSNANMPSFVPEIEVDEETLAEYDTDGDGVLSAAEYSAMMEAMLPEETEEKVAPPLPGAQLDDETVSAYDTDGDGVLSAEEFSAMMEAIRPDEEETEEDTSDTTDSNRMNLVQMAFQNRMFQAMNAYETQYKSMFESEDGSLLSNQA